MKFYNAISKTLYLFELRRPWWTKLCREALVIVIIAGLVSGQALYYTPTAYAATYSFTQSSWAGGATANNAVHASNQTGWTQFST